jgi:hypothetical protein
MQMAPVNHGGAHFSGYGCQGLSLRLVGRAIFCIHATWFRRSSALAIMNKNSKLNRVTVSMVRRGNHPSRLG